MVSKPKILVADDETASRKVLSELLTEMGYAPIEVKEGKRALEVITYEKPDIAILDLVMPEIDGAEVCRIVKSNPETKMIPVIIITAYGDDDNHLRALDAGADDFITKPFKAMFLKARLKSLVALKIMSDMTRGYQASLKKINVELMEKLITTQDVTIVALAKLAEFRDPETGEHLERMREYSKVLALELKNLSKYRYYISEHYIDNLYKSSPLHDIGKVGIADDVLLKPGKLSPGEFELMKRHTVIGGDALHDAVQLAGMERSFLDMGKDIAYYHHEKWDGNGYPTGLKEGDIPLSARILAIADVYDALTSKRVYKPAFPHAKARSIIIEECGPHFDPDILKAFISLEDVFVDIKKRFQDTTIKMAEEA
jgi:putative two-component system response regulator